MSNGISEQWMKEQIDHSNLMAAKNRNHYPIQEQATQRDLWEYVPCICNETCTCQRFGCTHHWKLKEGVMFEDFRDGYLRMFVDARHHSPLINALKGKGPDGLNTRAIGAFQVLQNLQESWQEIAEIASRHNRTLFCDDWMPPLLRDRMSFSVEGTSIYTAKQYCVLFPDIGVPYDTASRLKMLEHLDLKDVDYIEFLTRVRESFLECMTRDLLTIPSLRRLDDPQHRLPFYPSGISLARPGKDYGTAYIPTERTISLVLDKCFYHP